MGKKILMIGSTNTKGDQLRFLKEKIESRGHKGILMDISMGGDPALQPDITPEEIARLGGKDIEELIASKDRFRVTNVMTAGAQQKALELLSQGDLDGIVSLGGSTIALVGSQVMSKLPFGIPKVIGVPAAQTVYIGKWFSATDVIVMQLIMEIAGMNDLVKNAIAQVAGAISGMVEEAYDYTSLKLPYPSVAITELGFSDQCAKYVEQLLTEKGYHVYPFHAQGISDRAMDRLISQGFFDGVIEIVPAGLIEEKFKGNRPAGMQRLDAAGERGIPQVWAPCCLNLTGAGPTRTNREKYLASGRVLEIDEMRSMTRFPVDEMIIGAKLYAEKINKAKGPIKLVVPMRGWSSIDREGSILYDPAEDQIFIEELKKNLRAPLEIEEVDGNLEDFDTARALVDSLVRLMEGKKG
ncbi:MAG: Tm-1-like ATP-binding domain-containing protein [Desulfobacterales bacterium]|nr:MAG: Tm-1-like ATP-binding domain-containing protein [Desulfobacterales bacterium]